MGWKRSLVVTGMVVGIQEEEFRVRAEAGPRRQWSKPTSSTMSIPVGFITRAFRDQWMTGHPQPTTTTIIINSSSNNIPIWFKIILNIHLVVRAGLTAWVNSTECSTTITNSSAGMERRMRNQRRNNEFDDQWMPLWFGSKLSGSNWLMRTRICIMQIWAKCLVSCYFLTFSQFYAWKPFFCAYSSEISPTFTLCWKGWRWDERVIMFQKVLNFQLSKLPFFVPPLWKIGQVTGKLNFNLH